MHVISPKTRNAVYKDSFVAYLALKSQFAIADNYLSERNITQLGHLMLLHVIRLISPENECWTGEYYSACKFFLRENEAEAAGRATARKRARDDTLTSGEYSGELTSGEYTLHSRLLWDCWLVLRRRRNRLWKGK